MTMTYSRLNTVWKENLQIFQNTPKMWEPLQLLVPIKITKVFRPLLKTSWNLYLPCLNTRRRSGRAFFFCNTVCAFLQRAFMFMSSLVLALPYFVLFPHLFLHLFPHVPLMVSPIYTPVVVVFSLAQCFCFLFHCSCHVLVINHLSCDAFWF